MRKQSKGKKSVKMIELQYPDNMVQGTWWRCFFDSLAKSSFEIGVAHRSKSLHPLVDIRKSVIQCLLVTGKLSMSPSTWLKFAQLLHHNVAGQRFVAIFNLFQIVQFLSNHISVCIILHLQPAIIVRPLLAQAFFKTPSILTLLK